MRFPKCNLHTHTRFCDGKDSPEEIVEAALALGFQTLGFSGHSYTSFDDSCCMTGEREEKYRQEIARLKEEYSDKIRILCGIEQDFYSDYPAYQSDFAAKLECVFGFLRENSYRSVFFEELL